MATRDNIPGILRRRARSKVIPCRAIGWVVVVVVDVNAVFPPLGGKAPDWLLDFMVGGISAIIFQIARFRFFSDVQNLLKCFRTQQCWK